MREHFKSIDIAPKNGNKFLGRRNQTKKTTWWGLTPCGYFIGWLYNDGGNTRVWMPREWKPLKNT